jgi:peptidoglycan/xylan/chitin deacetylase (PgdA/CDA1 family)
MRAVRRELIRCAVASGMLRLARAVTGRRHVILTFHRVRPNEQLLDLFDTCPSVTVEMFRSVVEWVANRFDVVPLAELIQRGPGGRPAAAVTFDDGWRDNYDLAFPVLKRCGVPATIFVTTGKIGSSEPFWQQTLGRLFRRAANGLRPHLYRRTVQQWKKLTDEERQERWLRAGGDDGDDGDLVRCFLNADEIREMAGAGIDFGSHTVHHAILTQLSSSVLRAELAESKAALESILGRPVDTLAYPNGDCSDQVLRYAAATGYSIGCTTRNARISNTDHPLRLPRIEPEWDCPHDEHLFDETMFQWRAR